MLPWVLGFAAPIYGVTALACGAIFLALAFQLRRSSENDRQAAQRLFLFSISYLFLLFAALLVGNGSDPSSNVSLSGTRPASAFVPVAPLQRHVVAACSFTNCQGR
jgi:protoheme IX farnesyltransferase